MATVLILLAMFASLLLIMVVLIQPGKAEMISGMGGLGGQLNNILGVRAGRNILQNITIGLITAIILIAIAVNKLFLPSDEEANAPVTSGRSIPTNAIPNPPSAAPQPDQPGTPEQGN